MKVFLIIFFTVSCNITFAQNAKVDLKFEEVEIAFNNNDHKTVLAKLDEFDKLLGSVSSKSLYIRIVSQNKLFEENRYEDDAQFALLTSLRKNAESYLKAMENEGLDDKYREVNTIYKNLKELPNDKEAWAEKKRYDLEVKQNSEKAIDELKNLSLKIDEWEFYDKIKIEMTYQTFAQLNPNLRMILQPLGILSNGINANIYLWNPTKKQEKDNQQLFKDFSFTTYNNHIINYTIELRSIATKEDKDKKILEFLDQFDRIFLTENNERNKLNYLIASPWAKSKIMLTVTYADDGGYKFSLTKILMNINKYLN